MTPVEKIVEFAFHVCEGDAPHASEEALRCQVLLYLRRAFDEVLNEVEAEVVTE